MEPTHRWPYDQDLGGPDCGALDLAAQASCRAVGGGPVSTRPAQPLLPSPAPSAGLALSCAAASLGWLSRVPLPWELAP